MSRRRVLMVVHGPYSVAEPRVSQESRAALDAGFDVEVIAAQRPGEPERELVDGADVHRLPVVRRRGRGFVAMAREYVEFTLRAGALAAGRDRRADVVHVHNPPDFLVAAAVIPRLRGARTILDVHDRSADMFAMRFGRTPTTERLLLGIERAATRFADAVVTVHEPYKRALVERGVPEDKIVVVMNTVDERLLPPGRAQHDEFRVVYHGTVTPHYGVELLVEAAAKAAQTVSGLTLDVVGEGDAVPRVERRARELGFEHAVRLSRVYLDRTDAIGRAAEASVGVVPNLDTPLNRFALPSKLFEFVALGVPAVVADLPTIREHFPNGELLFFRPGDAADLTRALVETARDPEAAAARARHARRRLEADYGWPRSAERYVALLERLVRSK